MEMLFFCVCLFRDVHTCGCSRVPPGSTQEDCTVLGIEPRTVTRTQQLCETSPRPQVASLKYVVVLFCIGKAGFLKHIFLRSGQGPPPGKGKTLGHVEVQIFPTQTPGQSFSLLICEVSVSHTQDIRRLKVGFLREKQGLAMWEFQRG